MSFDDQRLLRHLMLAVLIKLALLSALWWFFVRDMRVAVNADQAAAQLGLSSQPPGGQP